jgi:serine/threonine-protein kinase
LTLASEPISVGFFDRLRWLGRLLLLLFVLGAAAFLSAITAMRLAIEGREVEMPNLVGQTYPQAEAALRARHLISMVADHAYSNLPVGSVVRESPGAGTKLKVGQLAQVVLSLGPQKVSVPNLVDRALQAARLELLTSGLQLGEVSYLYEPGEPADVVIQQDPLPGETGISSPRVSLLVSLGPRPTSFLMPNLVNMPSAEASKQLTSAGLPVPQLTPVESPGSIPGSVTGQTPAAGARVDSTTQVTLQVASRGGSEEGSAITGLAQENPDAEPGAVYARMPGRWR